jgi:GAF domain-containing protein
VSGWGDTSSDLERATSTDDVIDVVRQAARRLAGADGATFVLRDEDRCFYVDEDAVGPLWKGQRFPMESCISGWAMIHGETAVVPDIFVDDRIPLDAYRRTFVRSLAMAPIQLPGEDAVGAIGIYWSFPHEVTADERAVLEQLAAATATALTQLPDPQAPAAR